VRSLAVDWTGSHLIVGGGGSQSSRNHAALESQVKERKGVGKTNSVKKGKLRDAMKQASKNSSSRGAARVGLSQKKTGEEVRQGKAATEAVRPPFWGALGRLLCLLKKCARS